MWPELDLSPGWALSPDSTLASSATKSLQGPPPTPHTHPMPVPLIFTQGYFLAFSPFGDKGIENGWWDQEMTQHWKWILMALQREMTKNRMFEMKPIWERRLCQLSKKRDKRQSKVGNYMGECLGKMFSQGKRFTLKNFQ